MLSRWIRSLFATKPHLDQKRRAARLSLLPLEDRINPVVAFALSGSNLLRFDTAAPALVQATPITGVATGETLVGIDFRPQNGFLYGLGVNVTTDRASLYAISTRTGVAGLVGLGGSAGAIRFDDTSGGTVDLPDPTTVGYGFDFDPATDLIRVTTSSGLNFRVGPSFGAAGGDGDPNTPGVQPDGNVNGGGSAGVSGAAFTNNQPNNGNVSTLYTLDATQNALLIQSNPNAGTQTTVGTVTLGGNALDFTNVNGFDVPAGVNAAANNAAVTSGSGFAVLTVGGSTGLYSINLVNAQATLLGIVGNGAPAVQGLAIQSDLGGFPAIALDATGTSLLRFDTATPNTPTTVPITSGINAGDQLVALDYRPQTGQLFALGANTTDDTLNLYLVAPQVVTGGVETASVFPLGDTVTIIQLGTDLMPGDGYGFDFDPTTDRVRIAIDRGGLNLRVTPNLGLVTSNDAPINGSGSTGVAGAAYTNSFGQDVTRGNPTTLYTLDATLNRLFIQNTPNGGTQTMGVPVTLNGTALDFAAVNGFDIPAGVQVTSSNAAVTSGFGYAALTVGATTGLYRINLTSGAATLLGNVGAGATALAGLTLGDAPAGTVSFSAAGSFVAENGGQAAITLTRTGGSNGPLTVTVSATGGLATPDVDFTGSPYTVTFADGQTTATFNVPITDDTLGEINETIVLSIRTVSNAGTIGAQGTTTVTIADSDGGPGGLPPVQIAAGPDVLAIINGQRTTINPFPGFAAAVTTGKGDVSGDGTDDVIVSASVSGHIKVFDGVTGQEIRSFFPFVNYTGGIYVAGGDVNGDGREDIIAGATVNGHVKVFDGVTGAEIRSFFAYVNFAGEVRVASGDVDGDGLDDVITGAGSGAFGHVKVFSGKDNAEIRSFLAYTNFNGGIFVAAGDVNADGRDDVVTGAEANGHVKVFSGGDNAEIRSFLAFPDFVGQARVTTALVNADAGFDVLVGQGPGGTGLIRTFDGLTLAVLSEVTVADPSNFGIFIA